MPKKGDPESQFDGYGDELSGETAMPTTVDECIAALDFSELPNKQVWGDVVNNMIKDKFAKLVNVFCNYCKHGSDCATIVTASRLKLGGFRKLVKDTNLEVRVYDFDAMARLFAKCSLPTAASADGKKSIAVPNPEIAELQLHQFITLLINLSFYRENPRFVMSKDPAKMKEETVPVLQCAQNMLNEFLPRMQMGNAAEFTLVLRGDKDAQAVLAQYRDKVTDWIDTLNEAAKTAGTDVFEAYGKTLEDSTTLGVRSMQTTESTGLQVTHKSALTLLQARHAFLDAQDAEALAFGNPSYDVDAVCDALARCGDKKYSSILEMTFADRVRGMFQNLFGDATEMELITEAVTAGGAAGEDGAVDKKTKEIMMKNWLVCWRNMTFKDLHDFPLWETQLHDILKDPFTDLQNIFLFYCGNSIQGTENIATATKIGLMEMLAFAKDCDICNKEFKVDELTRHFCTANQQEAVAKSGSSDRHKMGNAETAKLAKTLSSRSARSNRSGDPMKAALANGKRSGVPDMQLNVFEFINFVVRIAFWRANPTWGSKYNTRELTPVPESVDILLKECILPKAKRDHSHEFKVALAKDMETQQVLAEYREKLQNWVRPILRSLRRTDYPNPQMTYKKWVELMDGPGGSGATAEQKRKPDCPKMVGDWSLAQESQITGDERVGKKAQMTFKAHLSIANCRWNFLRSQTVEQLSAGEQDAENGDYATLDFAEMCECIARCAVDTFKECMTTFLPSHGRNVMTMADAVRSWVRILLGESTHEVCIWELTVIKAERFDWQKASKAMAGQDPREHKLWQSCWQRMPLMDVHYFPLWEKGVHDVLQHNFPALVRIFSHYCKGISGMDTVTDALEMELEEFHDFIKDAKLETRMVNFTVMTNMFAKANAENSASVYEQRQAERRNVVVQREMEAKAKEEARKAMLALPISPKKGAFDKVSKKKDNGASPGYATDRFASEYPAPGSMKAQKPDNRLTLSEFLACLVRLSFIRANPKFGQYDNVAKLVGLPDCLDKMLSDFVLPNSKQDLSSLFREEIEKDLEVQAVFNEYREPLLNYYNTANELTSVTGKADGKLSLETWMDIVRGFLNFVNRKGVMHKVKTNGSDGMLGENAFVGDCSVFRESDITGDERCKEKYTCRLSVLEAKLAFLNSQSLDQMAAGDGEEGSAMATLDFNEFLECLARCARDKYCEIKMMTLADSVRGVIQNLLGEKSDETVIRDATYITADRYDWRLSKPLKKQPLKQHRRWLECWQNVEVNDLHHFPLWEKGVHDVLQECFQELVSIFSHYSKSIGGSTTAEDAVEMTLSEFRDLVRDVNLETKDLRFDVMCNMFKKANALNNADAHKQRQQEKGDSKAQGDAGVHKGGKKGAKRTLKSTKLRDDELDMELVLYEFVEVLIRISFWRANPFHGIHKLAQSLVPLPDCLASMLHEVVLPNAKRDDSAVFKETLANDKGMQAVLAEYDVQLREWFDAQTQSMFLRGEGRRLQYQAWQDVLKKTKRVGIWEINQDSEITGDERCRNKHKCSLSLPQAKFAFSNSQSTDQLSTGVAKDTDQMTTLDFDEFKECVARCGVDKYKPLRQMSAASAVKGMIQNLLEIANEEEVMWEATLIKAERFNWKRYSGPLQAQSLSDHKKWLDVWQRIEISDMYYYPLWEKQVHDVLQKHFADLTLIFLAYCRSILGSDTAEDAVEMEMAEFHDFVEECALETKEINFDMMSIMFTKANALNTNAAHEQLRAKRTTAKIKDASTSGGSKQDAKAGATGKVDATSGAGTAAPMDQELVLYEFMNMLIRISFQRANPTFGNFNSKRAVVHLPGCLEKMLEEEVLPRARKDVTIVFRETVMEEESVKAVLDAYDEKLLAWFTKITADDTRESDITDNLGFKQWMRVCDLQDLVGIWQCNRESDITGDPACKTEYKWRLSMPQAKKAFMDSQSAGELGAGKEDSTSEMAVLDFEEFKECCARCGCDKFRAVPEVSPAQAVEGFIQNLLGEKSADEVVLDSTHIVCKRFDAEAEATKLGTDSDDDHAKWLDCWSRMTIMDMHLWPMWEEEVHTIFQPLFKDLQAIFLAYTRSISEDSAEDAMEMSMDEFHDFIVDVGLETKEYGFDVMCNQFIKANAVDVAKVREQRQQEKRDADSFGNDVPEWKKKQVGKLKGTDDGRVAKKDQELVLYEFLNMLVRIAFWRANPSFGLHGVTAEPVAVPLALSTMLNEIVLPKAKRENWSQFRDKEMTDPALLAVIEEYKPKLLAWYKKKTSDDTEEDHVSDKLGFDEWLRVLDRQDLVGIWEVEQMSEITGDVSCKGNVKCRLSVPTAKAAFLDSQKQGQLGVGQAVAAGESTVLDFEEWLECLARTGVSKYSSVKQLSKAAAVKGFLQNFFGEMSEEDVMRSGTYIRAVRFDYANEAKPCDGQTSEDFNEWIALFPQIELSGLYSFPLWEKEVHNTLQKHFKELKKIFAAYCKSLGEAAGSTGATEMSLDEFYDFVIDVGLETYHSQPYTFEDMKAQFTRGNYDGKGLASKSKQSKTELVLHEFLNVLVRVSFWRLNPEFGELLTEHDTELVPVPVALERMLTEDVLPKAHRDDSEDFRMDVMSESDVKAVVEGEESRLQAWYDKLPRDEESKVGLQQWISTLHSLNVIGTFSCFRGSDVVGDAVIGTEFKSRLSVPQAKRAFVDAQREQGLASADVTLDFDELVECIARCGVAKYRGVSEFIKPADAIAGFIQNILGDCNEDAVITKHTYVTAQRFEAPGGDDAWTAVWELVELNTLHHFPLWEGAVHDVLKANFAPLQSIFRAYAAGSGDTGNTPGGDASTMDMDEFQDFVIEADLLTPEYGFEVIQGQFTKAIDGGDDSVLQIHEFLTMLVRIAWYRSNPRHGLLGKKVSDGNGGYVDYQDAALPGCLETMLTKQVFPNSRRDDGPPFSETLLKPDVHSELQQVRHELSQWYELVSGGRSGLQLSQWLGALEEKLLFSDLSVLEHRCRFTEPQARTAFVASCSNPKEGMQPEELQECVARCGVDKYKLVAPMSKAQAVNGFIQNLFGKANEEEVIYRCTGNGEPPAAKIKGLPKPTKRPPKKKVERASKPQPAPGSEPAAPVSAPEPVAEPEPEPEIADIPEDEEEVEEE